MHMPEHRNTRDTAQCVCKTLAVRGSRSVALPYLEQPNAGPEMDEIMSMVQNQMHLNQENQKSQVSLQSNLATVPALFKKTLVKKISALNFLNIICIFTAPSS